jgi:hypothetical protein
VNRPNFIQIQSQESKSLQVPLRTLESAFVGNIFVRGVPISCIFDSGSTNTWIQHENIGTEPIPFGCSILFGSGELEGQFYYDDFTIGGLFVPHQAFGRAFKN